MKLKGRTHVFGDDVNTDYIISGKYKFKTLDMNELATHVMEDLDPDFYDRIDEGDLIVAGSNFGCGSSREQAPLAIKHAGIGAVIAKSFARIFYRNAINVGLPVIEADTDKLEAGDSLEIDLEAGEINNLTRDLSLTVTPLPRVMIKILNDGGLAGHFRKHGGFHVEGSNSG
ncbi:MAG: 3-isopropylmalate dehydratase small subunit [Bacillota bacterium]